MIRVAVFGSNGFVGEELMKLLGNHLHIRDIMSCRHREKIATLRGIEVAFLATPVETSLELVPSLLEHGIRVIDLSGAFRLRDPTHYHNYYKFKRPHPHPQLLQEAVYGLPEANRGGIARAQLVTSAGCYATASILALLPLKDMLAEYSSVRVDAISGYTGAGKGGPIPKQVTPYDPGRLHRHIPEIEQVLNAPNVLRFYPSIAPFPRGILARVNLPADVCVSPDTYADYYRQERLIRVVHRASVLEIENKNLCQVSVHGNVIYAALDNLGKGAAGQALQNMNIMMDIPETTGLA